MPIDTRQTTLAIICKAEWNKFTAFGTKKTAGRKADRGLLTKY